MAGEYVEVSGYSRKDIDDAERIGEATARTRIVGDTTAAQADVLTGKTFSSAVAGDKKAGGMSNNGAVNATINPGGSYTVPAGYHNGGGIVRANANQNTGVYNATARGAALDMGVNNTYRYVNTNGVPNSNSGIYTSPMPTDGTENANTFDMGAANTYRYVKTKNSYDKGYSAGFDAALSGMGGSIPNIGSAYLTAGDTLTVPEFTNSTSKPVFMILTISSFRIHSAGDYADFTVEIGPTSLPPTSLNSTSHQQDDGHFRKIIRTYIYRVGALGKFSFKVTNGGYAGGFTYSLSKLQTS